MEETTGKRKLGNIGVQTADERRHEGRHPKVLPRGGIQRQLYPF